jgi:hypothetical protein
MYIPRTKRQRAKTQTVTKTFECIGVDFRKEDCDRFHSPDSSNMYRSQSGEWEAHPGFRVIGTLTGKFYGIEKFQYTDGTLQTKVLIHHGTKLYTWDNYPSAFTSANVTEIYDGLPESVVKFATFKTSEQAIIVILGGGKLIYYDGTTVSDMTDDAFIPQTWTLKSPDASAGTAYQQRNLLQPKFIEGFVGNYYELTDTFTATAGQTEFTVTKPIKTMTSVLKNGSAATYTNTATKVTLNSAAASGDAIEIKYFTGDNVYKLSVTDLDADEVTITIDDVAKTENTHFTVDRTKGWITFESGQYPPAPDIPGTELVLIHGSKTTVGYEDMILGCTEMLVFDNRLFLTGNPAYPNRIFWTGFQEPSYFGETMFNDRAGSGSVPVSSLQLLSSDAFLALKKNTVQDGAYSVISPQELSDENNPKTYVAQQGSGTIGCLSKDSSKVFLDDNVFMSTNGLDAISRELNISNERNIEHRSSYVDSRLLLEDLDSCICEQYGHHLYVLCPESGNIYIADAYLAIEAGKLEGSPYFEYNWARLQNQGIYKNQYIRYIDENGETTNPPEPDGTEGGTHDGATATSEYIGGTFYPAINIKSLGDKELFLLCDGLLCKYNFDLTRLDKANELSPAAYSLNNRAIGEYYKTSFDWYEKTNFFKRLINGRNDLLLSTRVSSRVNVTWRTEKTILADSKVIALMSSGVSFTYTDFAHRKFGALPKASYVLKKMRPKDFRRLQICITGSAMNCCTAFLGLTIEAEILDNDLK